MSTEKGKGKRKKTRWTNVVRYPDGTYYAFVKPIGGGKVREISLKTKKAMEVEDALHILKLKETKSDRMGSKLPFAKITDDFLKHRLDEVKKGSIRQPTYKEAEDIIRLHLNPFFGKKMIADIDHELWEKFTKQGPEIDYRNPRKILRQVLTWCMRKKWISVMPLNFELPHHEKREGVALTDEMIVKVLEKAKGRFLLFASMYLFMAMRRTEIATLEKTSVNLEQDFVLVTEQVAKTRKSRIVRIHPFVRQLLIEQMQRDPKSPYVFPNAKDNQRHCDPGGFKTAWNTVKRNLNKEGIDLSNIVNHDLRRTWKTRAHMDTRFTDTQKEKFAGSSIEVQKRDYVKFNPKDLEGLENVVTSDEIEKVLSIKAATAGKKMGRKASKLKNSKGDKEVR